MIKHIVFFQLADEDEGRSKAENALMLKKEFEKGDQENLEFLVVTDQKLNKLFCFRFWPVNYLFADGPIHEFYVENS